MNVRRWAIGLFALTVMMIVAGIASSDLTSGSDLFIVISIAGIALVYVGAGGLLVARLPRNPVGWLMIGIGLGQAVSAFVTGYASLALDRGGPNLPLGEIAWWLSTSAYIPSVGLLITLLLLLFPDGKPPSPRWRVVGRAAVIGIALQLVGDMAGTWPQRHLPPDLLDNVETTGLSSVVMSVGILIVMVAAIASVASLVVRFHRATGDERQQLRWFVFAAAVVVVGAILAFPGIDSQFIVLIAGFFLIPVTAAIAILKFRLYDLDLVIRKTVIITTMAAVLIALYLSVIALATFGTISGVVVGVALLAVTFNPVRRGARGLADRVVYGRRATSYEVLSDFSGRVSEAYATDDVLPRMAQILLGATGATSASVWLMIGDAFHVAATAGEVAVEHEVAAAGDESPVFTGATGVEVRHQGELLGALTVSMPANDPLDPTRERLVRDVASQAGLVVRNARLIEELRASRQRLVVAQDQERRKIERNLHDGVQQQLVAMTVQLGLLTRVVETDPAKALDMAATLQIRATEALDDLRDLARGIYPPLLADKGIVTALEAQARKAAVPTTVAADGVGRYPQEVESAVYFCVLEALNNVAKYARAGSAVIELTQRDGNLRFLVRDDGEGFDTGRTSYGTGLQGMADRLDAIGGALTVTSVAGQGATIMGAIATGGAS